MDKIHRCNICGTELLTKERLKRPWKVHDKDQKFWDAAYVDPGNAGFGGFINPDGALDIVGGVIKKQRRKKISFWNIGN